MEFQATLELSGKTATGIRVPEAVVRALGKGQRPPVTVTINGYSYRSTVAPYSGDYLLPVSAEVRAGAGISAGNELTIQVELDMAPREVEVPADLTSALDANPAAKVRFEALSYSNKRRTVLQIEGAKTAETRQRRIEKSVADLTDGKL